MESGLTGVLREGGKGWQKGGTGHAHVPREAVTSTLPNLEVRRCQ
jgi:hypothetical protein